VREAVDVDYIVVANNKEALALENNLIKQRKPRFNILLRDDKTYPYVKLTLGERFPRVYVTRRLRKDGSVYYGPYFPTNLAYRIVDLIHRHFLVPSCKVDLTRFHPRPCLQYYIRRCLGPCVEGLTTPHIYQEAVRDVKLFLEGRQTDLVRSLRKRMEEAATSQEYERAAKYRDLISTVEQLQEKQRMAGVEGDDADVFGYHYENGMLAVNLFHMRGGKVVDRREFFWEDLPEFSTAHVGTDASSVQAERSSAATASDHEQSSSIPDLATGATSVADTVQGGTNISYEPPCTEPGVGTDASSVQAERSSAEIFENRHTSAPAHPDFDPGAFFSAFLGQLYIGQPYVPRNIYVPTDFEDRTMLEELLSEQLANSGARATRVHIEVPLRGEKRSLIDLAGNNAKQSYDQRFRVMKPNTRAIQEALQEALGLAESSVSTSRTFKGQRRLRRWSCGKPDA
jgi:excinuclease ABC subunit C